MCWRGRRWVEGFTDFRWFWGIMSHQFHFLRQLNLYEGFKGRLPPAQLVGAPLRLHR